MVGGKLEMRWCGSELRQTTTASARNSAILSSVPWALKMLSLTPGTRSCWKPPIDSAAWTMARRMRVSSNFVNARLRFWTLTMRFWTAMWLHYTRAAAADNAVRERESLWEGCMKPGTRAGILQAVSLG